MSVLFSEFEMVKISVLVNGMFDGICLQRTYLQESSIGQSDTYEVLRAPSWLVSFELHAACLSHTTLITRFMCSNLMILMKVINRYTRSVAGNTQYY